MAYDDDLLVFRSVAVDGFCDQLGERLGGVGVDVVGLEVAQPATGQIDRQTWCCVDQRREERRELGCRATQAVDEDQERDVCRELAGLGVRMVHGPDVGVRRRTGGVRRVGGVLAEQAGIGGLG